MTLYTAYIRRPQQLTPLVPSTQLLSSAVTEAQFYEALTGINSVLDELRQKLANPVVVSQPAPAEIYRDQDRVLWRRLDTRQVSCDVLGPSVPFRWREYDGRSEYQPRPGIWKDARESKRKGASSALEVLVGPRPQRPGYFIDDNDVEWTLGSKRGEVVAAGTSFRLHENRVMQRNKSRGILNWREVDTDTTDRNVRAVIAKLWGAGALRTKNA